MGSFIFLFSGGVVIGYDQVGLFSRFGCRNSGSIVISCVGYGFLLVDFERILKLWAG